ncbi:BMP family lipoprotein [Kutzneria sp. CA-103260]|uniref:BMP family lipoprotein n=1 Tax=Kutzneria sp. CA-103260 TaxID=2802641 RepID=UPI001BA98B5B|nr:BMP family ABC transporter substrate-binding protein [Kutzneria sp. CA-103260]
MRGVAVAAIALTSVMSMAACAKDSTSSSAGGSSNSASGSGCKLATPPTAAAAGSSTTTSSSKVDGSALKVGLAYDIGGRGDASFNDAAAAGLDLAKSQLGVKAENVKETTAAPNESDAAKEARLRQLAQDGYNPIVTVGFAYGPALQNVAKDFPNTKFAIVDSTVENSPNVTPLTFTEEQGSFLVGVIAAYKSKGCHVGFVGGVNVPLIQKFQAGFDAGAKAAAPDIKIEDKYITPAGDFTGFQAPDKGRLVAQGELSAGADVIYQAAGNSGKGIFDAVKAKSGTYAIGVDSDQYKQAGVADDKDIIISSMMKRVDTAVYDFLRGVAAGDLTSIPKVFDLAVGGVDYATSGGKVDDIKSTVDAYKAQIISGAIKVPSTVSGS